MIVVILVAILAALAIPTLTSARADRLPAVHATRLSMLIRGARARAIDRGTAVMVALSTGDASGDRGTFAAFEAVGPNPTGAGANRQPLNICRGAHWANDLSATTAYNVATNNGFGMTLFDGYRIGGAGLDGEKDVRTFIGGVASASQCVCFSPSGRAYADACTVPVSGALAPSVAPQFANLVAFNGVNITIQRGPAATPIGLRRAVIIPPNGATRVVSTP